jgi:hypothetical protein
MLAPMVVGIGILGVEVPDDWPVFLTTLAVHVAAGLICVVAGALAASAAKRPGRHPRAGTVYVWGLAVMFATATVLAGLRWRQDRHLFLIACVAFGLGATGWIARRRRWHRWMLIHGSGDGRLPTSRCSPASTSTTARSYRSGTGYHTGASGSSRPRSGSR